ncbi:MAG: SCO6745 family protein [Acidimicrobiales bacterium]
MISPDAARTHWQHLECVHAVVYFSPEVIEAMMGLGLRGFWSGYFAGRAAPLGPVGPAVVEALFYNFSPDLVRRALPAAWQVVTPDLVSSTRLHSVDAALWSILGEQVRTPELVAVAQLARRAAEAADCSGRALAAAHAAQQWPTVAHLVLWQAATVLREHRGDGHVSVLVNEGISGVAAHLLAAASGQSDADQLREARFWSQAHWDDAAEDLRSRGLLDEAGKLTKRGRALKVRIEAQTDRLAAGPYQALNDDEQQRLLSCGARLAQLVVRSEVLPFPNPMGLARPERVPEPGDGDVIDLTAKDALPARGASPKRRPNRTSNGAASEPRAPRRR